MIIEGKEVFDLFAFTVMSKVESKIRKGHYHDVATGLRCVRCDRIGKMPENNQQVRCQGCGLLMHVAGNGITCL